MHCGPGGDGGGATVTYKSLCCGVEVVGRAVLVWLVLAVPDPEDRCPRCGRWTKFAPAGCAEKVRRAA